jgi:hypothetical protein
LDFKIYFQKPLTFCSFQIITNSYTSNPENEEKISIEPNTKRNDSIQFLVKVKLTHDPSTGISLVKIFCFDLLLLLLNTTKINFLIHDSKIFDGTDTNIISKYLKYVYDNYSDKYQFIFSINQNIINELKNKFSYKEEYGKIVNKNIKKFETERIIVFSRKANCFRFKDRLKKS